MLAIIKREISSYFSSATGYLFLALFYLVAGIIFVGTTLTYKDPRLTFVYATIFIFVCLLIPILTMRLISEDKKQKTDQALFTAPIRLSTIAIGKYLSALFMFFIGIFVTIVYALIVSFFSIPDWPVILGSFVGILLLGSALIAIGMFFSSLTESQVVAAISTLGVSLIIIFTDFISSIINVKFIKNIINSLSFNNHYQNFSSGIFSLSDTIFFLSVSALFIFLTVRVLYKKRWN